MFRFVLCGLVMGGCVVQDATQVDITLPDKAFSIDASRWRVDPSEASKFTAMECSSTPVCNASAELACEGGDCAGQCDPESAHCQLVLEIKLYDAVDVATEQPALKTLPETSVVKVDVDRVTFDVTGSTLNVATPELTVLIAPASVTDPADGEATPIGTIAPLAAGLTLNDGELALSAEGEAALAEAMSSFRTPFNVLLGATLTLADGDPVPTGKLDGVIHIKAHASL